ncbi:MAG: carbohydrate ABC transporter permease [Eubacteriales bacterium]
MILKAKHMGKISTIIIWALLLCFGYVFIYPFVYAIAMSFMSYEDKLNPLVYLIPSSLSLENYQVVFEKLDYWKILLQTIAFSCSCALAQTISCCIIGYGFGTYDFKLKRVFIFIILLSFIVPAQVTSIPTYLLLKNLSLINTPFAMILPAAMGQGIRSSIFIFIYYLVFYSVPKSIDEAAQVDGAGALRRFFQISIPLAKSGILLTFLFSMVWYWNETYLTYLFTGTSVQTLPIQLRVFVSSLNINSLSEGALQMFETIEMAAVIVSLLPLVLMYVLLQRHFTGSIDKSGITGE